MSEHDAKTMERILLGPAWLLDVKSIEHPHQEVYKFGQIEAVDIVPTAPPVFTVECRCIHCDSLVTTKTDNPGITLTGKRGMSRRICEHTREELLELKEELRHFAEHYGKASTRQYVHLRISR